MIIENSCVKRSKFEEKRPAYILTTLDHLEANLKHSTYHEKLGIVHLHGSAYSRKKLLLICVAGVLFPFTWADIVHPAD